MAAYKVINLNSPIESDYWVDIPVRDPATNKDAVDEEGRILVERHVTRSVKNEEMSTINAAVETVNTLKEDYSTFKEEVSTKVNTHDSNILTNTNNITTLTDSVNNHDLQINALYSKINAIQGIDIDDFKYVTETDIKNIKKNYLPLAGGTVTGDLVLSGKVSSNSPIKANLQGTADRAIGDTNGKALTSYIANLNVSGASVTVTNGAGTRSNYTVNNVNHATHADSATNATNATNATHATSADSATKATNDSSNRNIVNTYALKSNYPDRIKFAWDTTFKGYVNVTVDKTTWGLITSQNISSQSVKHATSADNATNANHAKSADSATTATNLGGYPASHYVRSVNGVNANAQGNVQLGNIGVITGEIKWFAFNKAPAGYLVCNGANVSRKTYTDLFKAIGTTFGRGDGSTTFTLPNLIDKFAQGSTSVGTVKSAGLPDINGRISLGMNRVSFFGAFYSSTTTHNAFHPGTYSDAFPELEFSASRSNKIYGNSLTVQPPALTLLPCIKY